MYRLPEPPEGQPLQQRAQPRSAPVSAGRHRKSPRLLLGLLSGEGQITVGGLPQTKLIASHDLDMILDTCQRVILLSHGKIAADGDAEAILQDKALLEANRMELPFCLQGWHKN